MAVSKVQLPRAEDLFPSKKQLSVDEYNYEHFRFKEYRSDMKRTIQKVGIPPGAFAPDFELPRVGGGTLRLSDLQDKPVILHFGSFT
jgi:hypothetical protein